MPRRAYKWGCNMLLTVKDYAKLNKKDVSTIYKQVKKQDIQSIEIDGLKYVTDKDDQYFSSLLAKIRKDKEEWNQIRQIQELSERALALSQQHNKEYSKILLKEKALDPEYYTPFLEDIQLGLEITKHDLRTYASFSDELVKLLEGIEYRSIKGSQYSLSTYVEVDKFNLGMLLSNVAVAGLYFNTYKDNVVKEKETYAIRFSNHYVGCAKSNCDLEVAIGDDISSVLKTYQEAEKREKNNLESLKIAKAPRVVKTSQLTVSNFKKGEIQRIRERLQDLVRVKTGHFNLRLIDELNTGIKILKRVDRQFNTETFEKKLEKIQTVFS